MLILYKKLWEEDCLQSKKKKKKTALPTYNLGRQKQLI